MPSSYQALLEAAGFPAETAGQIVAAQSKSFDQLVAEIGYPAADAASQLSSVERNYELGKSEIAAAGEEERRQIDVSAEDRGILRSGHRNQDQARQQEREARKVAGLDVAVADDIAGIDRGLARSAAQIRAEQYLTDQQRALDDQQLSRALGLARADSADIMAQLPQFGDY
jgi:hypothetical protein